MLAEMPAASSTIRCHWEVFIVIKDSTLGQIGWIQIHPPVMR
jgi:hypothetical protein